ncbi:Sphingosine 1-phosphate receptor 1 [Frankliniella fusca]|uniref:Sphingosine 1-phosphate receptor 1 n=1 Tax=Frankliniella fusca TaxID=407009 RepID=A0AAE1HY57_9NEOP|nr:Sphingosine 1-phosphate receptor 1 [Frankliniella fusca]
MMTHPKISDQEFCFPGNEQMKETFTTMLYMSNDQITGFALNGSDEHMINVNHSKHQTVWITVESLLLLCILCGNTLTICAVVLSRRLARATSSQFVLKLAWTVIGSGWIYSMIISITPLYWNNWPAPSCELHEVLPVPFTMLVLTPNFALIWIVMFLVYWRIWREAASVRRRWGNYQGKPPDGKSIQVVLLVLGSFSICWMPFFTVLILQALGCLRQSFSSTLYKSALALAMTNSWMNPLIYAWKNSEFLSAFSQLLHCKIPSTDPTGCGSIGQIALEGGPSQ